MTSLCKAPLLLSLLLFLVVESFAAAITVNSPEPWNLVLKTGESLPVQQIVFDKDTSDNTIVIFQRADGSKGFADIDNIVLTDEFKNILSQMSDEIRKEEGLEIDSEPEVEATPHYAEATDSSPSHSSPPALPRAVDPEVIVALLNQMYGNVCRAEIKGIFSKTLKIDWTGNTVMLHAAKVLGEVGSVKDQLYLGGIRYFQFPNDAGTYNVIDWKTGEKKSISDRAPYYFKN